GGPGGQDPTREGSVDVVGDGVQQTLDVGQRITAASSAVHATVYRTFLAVLSMHGRCGCLTDTHAARLFTAAQAKGESPRHCTDAWTNALTTLGL
ncbi:DNA primase, partial [Streptomyces sp. NPDC006333]